MAEPLSYGYPNAAITADRLPVWQQPLARFTVAGPDDWKVSALGSLDRGIRVEAGTGSGDAVTDITTPYETMSLPKPDVAARWYLIVRRRNWSGTGTTTLAAIVGTTSTNPVLPSRFNEPGSRSDQPLALVRVTQANSTVQQIIDLRCWAANGGVEAAHELALSYLAAPGAAVKIGQTEHRYELQANGVWGWRSYQLTMDSGVYTPVWSGFQWRGDTHISKGSYWVDGDKVTVKAMIQSGRNPSLGLGNISFSLPPGHPTAADFMSVGTGVHSTSGTGGSLRTVVPVAGPGQSSATVWVDKNPFVSPGRAGYGWGEGAAFHVQIEYRRPPLFEN